MVMWLTRQWPECRNKTLEKTMEIKMDRESDLIKMSHELEDAYEKISDLMFDINYCRVKLKLTLEIPSEEAKLKSKKAKRNKDKSLDQYDEIEF